MDAKELRAHLAEVHAELANAGKVDPETRQLLGEVMADIARVIDSVEPQESQAKSPAQRLEGIAVRFEAGHPALAASIRRFVDLLGKVGV